MKKIFYILLAVLILFSCRTSKSRFQKETMVSADTVYRDRTVVDTLIIERIKEVSLPVQHEIELDNPCDSLGRLQPFSIKFGSGKNTGSLISKEGKLYYSLMLDSVVSQYFNEYHSKFVRDSVAIRKALIKEFEAKERVQKVVWPWWLYVLIIGFIGSVLLNLLQRLKLIKMQL